MKNIIIKGLALSACEYIRVCAHWWVHVWRPKVTNLGCHSLPTLHLIGLEITKKSRLMGAVGILLSVPPQPWDCKHEPASLGFLDMGSRDQTQCHVCVVSASPVKLGPSPKAALCFLKLPVVPLGKPGGVYRVATAQCSRC